MLNDLAYQIYKANKAKGFWTDNPKDKNFGEVCALIHSEVSEALEAHRIDRHANPRDVAVGSKFVSMVNASGNPENGFKEFFEGTIKNTLEDELADTIIRVLDYCGANNIDIESHIALKLAYNKMRPHKHGKLL